MRHPYETPAYPQYTDQLTRFAIFSIGMALGSMIGGALTAIVIHAGGLCQ